ncbi:MAG TPA: hypothetical protein VMN81_03500 [Vicinamibacterales bacterium]|nr:hypothetical protein [Vicinamibacterales bacterium]
MSTMKRVELVATITAILASGHIVVAQAEWQRVSNEPGRFSVMVPAPLVTQAPTTDANGIVTRMFIASHAGKTYVIGYADGGIPDRQREMDDARDALLKGLSASLVSEHRFKSAQPVGETMATEFNCRSESQGTECKVRTFSHNSRLYMVGALWRTGTGSSLDTDKFLDSFRITS